MGRGNGVRRPATKFPHLVKQMRKNVQQRGAKAGVSQPKPWKPGGQSSGLPSGPSTGRSSFD